MTKVPTDIEKNLRKCAMKKNPVKNEVNPSYEQFTKLKKKSNDEFRTNSSQRNQPFKFSSKVREEHKIHGLYHSSSQNWLLV